MKSNIVAFDTVHPAFDKACHYFSIECRKVPSDFNLVGSKKIGNFEYESVKNLLKPYIDSNTICLVGSAPGTLKLIQSYCVKNGIRNPPIHAST